MNKMFIILISLFLIAAVASVSAADVDSAIAQNDAIFPNGGCCVADVDSVSLNDSAAVIDSVDDDLVVDDVDPIFDNDTAADVEPIIDNNTAIDIDANSQVDADENGEIEKQPSFNTTGFEEVYGKPVNRNLFNGNNPNHFKYTQEKLDSLKGEIDKYTEYFKKTRYTLITKHGQERYCPLDLILEVYYGHSYEDTVIIVYRALKNNGYFSTECLVEETMNEMRNGTVEVYPTSRSAVFYYAGIRNIEYLMKK